jgi:co-chaperonin GroES (HSP10)
MKLEQFLPSFRNVLILEVKEVKTEGGIYLPPSVFIPQDDKLYEVIKTGPKCEELEVGDKIYLSPGIRISTRRIEGETYGIVYEQQVEGRFREEKKSDMADFVLPEPELEPNRT